MTLVRRLARPCLASMFVTGGLDALRNPAAQGAGRRPGRAADRGEAAVPPGGPRAAGQAQRRGPGRRRADARARAGSRGCPSALLAGSLVPTTLAGHRFWEEEDATKRAQQRIHFFKNLGLLGGLILAAVDTEGRPGSGLAGPARRAPRRGQHPAHPAGRSARGQAGRPRRPGAPARLTVRPAARRPPATTLAAMIEPWPAPCAGRARCTATVALPGSKSVTNRALVLAALPRRPTHAGRRRCAAATPS